MSIVLILYLDSFILVRCIETHHDLEQLGDVLAIQSRKSNKVFILNRNSHLNNFYLFQLWKTIAFIWKRFERFVVLFVYQSIYIFFQYRFGRYETIHIKKLIIQENGSTAYTQPWCQSREWINKPSKKRKANFKFKFTLTIRAETVNKQTFSFRLLMKCLQTTRHANCNQAYCIFYIWNPMFHLSKYSIGIGFLSFVVLRSLCMCELQVLRYSLCVGNALWIEAAVDVGQQKETESTMKYILYALLNFNMKV